jgi:hypothetical protein
MNSPRPPDRSPAAPGRDRAGQRFGHVTGDPARTAAEPGTHVVLDDETGITYTFGYADIVTEGLRSLRTGERVRFLIDQGRPGHATYVIRLDLPDITELYT